MIFLKYKNIDKTQDTCLYIFRAQRLVLSVYVCYTLLNIIIVSLRFSSKREFTSIYVYPRQKRNRSESKGHEVFILKQRICKRFPSSGHI